MSDKLKELTNKIYSEGVGKAEKEAAEIIENAQKDAEKILKDAEKQAKQIKESAEKESEELKKNVESEIKLSARQAINALKQNITELIVTKVSQDETEKSLKDSDFIKKIIENLIKSYTEKNESQLDVSLLLPEKMRKELEDYFEKKQKALLNKGLEIKFSDEIKAGFEIGPKDNSYKISFSDETFEAFFKNYLRPRSVNLLYNK